MEKIVMSVEELAEILKQVRELPDGVIGDEYCSVCREMHDECPVTSDKDCPHEEIVECRYFVRQHYKQFIKRNVEIVDKSTLSSAEFYKRHYKNCAEKEIFSYLNRPVSECDLAFALAMVGLGARVVKVLRCEDKQEIKECE